MPNRNNSVSVELRYSLSEEWVFRYQVVEDVLEILIDQPYATYSMSELADFMTAN